MNQEYQQPTFLPREQTQHPKNSQRHSETQIGPNFSDFPSALSRAMCEPSRGAGVCAQGPSRASWLWNKAHLVLGAQLWPLLMTPNPSQAPMLHPSALEQGFSTHWEFLLPPSVPQTLRFFILNLFLFFLYFNQQASI